MAYRITSDCIACGDCSVVCPNDAVDDGYSGEKAGNNVIDDENVSGLKELQHYHLTDQCDGCGQCLDVCPTGAITVDG